MNKRLPILLSLLGVILLAASLAYWILQLYQPPQRPLAAVPRSGMPDPSIEAAATLFGGQISTASASSYQLTGVVAAGNESWAIIVAEGSPPKALRVGKEVGPGITLAEVHPRYVMLSDGGVMKRLDLAPDTKPPAAMGSAVNQVAPAAAAMPANLAPGAAVPEPPMSPGAVQQQPAQPQPLPQPGEVAQGGQTFPDPGNPGQVSGPAEEPQQAPATPNVAVPNNANNQNNANNPAPAPVQMPPPTRAAGQPVSR